MQFDEKLNILFELTAARGKDLAEALSVTAPQISKMRRGRRDTPKNRESLMIISRFFAQR